MKQSDREWLQRPLVYVAGPYTNPDPVKNTHRAIHEGNRLVEQFKVAVIIPHLTMLWHAVTPKEIDFWYGHDLAHMSVCDVVYRMEGASSGADNEVQVALEFGLPVCYDDEGLLLALRKWKWPREES